MRRPTMSRDFVFSTFSCAFVASAAESRCAGTSVEGLSCVKNRLTCREKPGDAAPLHI